VGQHHSASASRLLGLDGWEVHAAQVAAGEWQLEVQTTATLVGCIGCGMRAELHGRRTVRVRDCHQWPVGRVGLAQADLALSGAGLQGPDLDRADGRDPPPGGADRTGPGRGLPAGRHRRPRSRRDRP
jgi:hypothetical protein